MGIAAGIDNYCIVFKSVFLDFINQFSLDIALKIRKLYLRKPGLQIFKVFFKIPVAINFRLPFPKKVKIRSINYCYFHAYPAENLNPFVQIGKNYFSNY